MASVIMSMVTRKSAPRDAHHRLVMFQFFLFLVEYRHGFDCNCEGVRSIICALTIFTRQRPKHLALNLFLEEICRRESLALRFSFL